MERKKDIEIVYQVFPMVTGFAESTEAWESNKAEILGLLRAGKNVAPRRRRTTRTVKGASLLFQKR